MDNKNQSLKRLFQEEYTKMVALICKLSGLEHIEIAEDIVSETFLVAVETWGVKGIPPNPVSWLYVVAKQKMSYHFRRNKILVEKVLPRLTSDLDEFNDVNFTFENIKDSQMRMMFAICNPAIPSESQIGLALRILCGFGIDEIAEAFLTNKETINKRLFRGKEILRREKISLDLSIEHEISERLDNVLYTIYLLFNEGYYSKTQNQILRKDLCLEAMRLGLMLTGFEPTNVPKTNALVALMCFHSSRFEARQNTEESFILYEDQDESLWNHDLIDQGNYYLDRSASGNEISSYHLEAGIAFLHSTKEDTTGKWQRLLDHYNMLSEINHSPIVLVNRVYTIYRTGQKELALIEAEKLNLVNNHFYFVLLGNLYAGIDNDKAKSCLEKAYLLAKTQTERQHIQSKIDKLG